MRGPFNKEGEMIFKIDISRIFVQKILNKAYPGVFEKIFLKNSKSWPEAQFFFCENLK